jgi:PAS domain S-box-containing protein
MRADHASSPILTPKSLRRRRLSLVAFLLGLGSVILSLAVVVVSLLQNRDAAEQAYLKNTRNEVRMLATVVDYGRKETDEQLLNVIADRWVQAGHWNRDPDEHFLIVNNVDSEVILDTAYRGPSHRPPPSNAINQVILAVREQMGPLLTPALTPYSDAFQPESGEPVLGSFINCSQPNWPLGRNWLLGVYRSKADLRASVTKLSLFGTLILVCGLAMPVSLLLMYYTYQIAQRDQALAEQARARLAAIVQDSDDAIFSETFDGVITSWNRGAERLFGYSESEALGRGSTEIFPSERPAEERQIIAGVSRGEQLEERAFETIRVCKDGTSVHVLQTISPINDARGRHVGVSIIARDVTARKNLEREVLESTSREQQRIGQELHDSLGQELTGLSYLAKSLAQKLAASDNPHGETAQTIATGIQRALREVRRAVQGLVPVEVDSSGFMVALEKLTAQTQERCGIECRIDCREPLQVDDNVLATHLFRIVQEAINNAVKHAGARHITVRPESHNGTLTVTVEDDGVGIAEHARRNGGMGLRIMQYRAGVIDATLDIRRANAGGTAVVCLVKNQRDKTEP